MSDDKQRYKIGDELKATLVIIDDAVLSSSIIPESVTLFFGFGRSIHCP